MSIGAGEGGRRMDTNPQRLPEIGDLVGSKSRVGMGADDWASGFWGQSWGAHGRGI